LLSEMTTSFCKRLVTFNCFFLDAEGFTHNPFLDGLVAVESVAFAAFAFLEELVAVDCVAALLDLFLLPEVLVGLNGSLEEGAKSSVGNIFSQSMMHSLNISNSLSFQGGMDLLNLATCSGNFCTIRNAHVCE